MMDEILNDVLSMADVGQKAIDTFGSRHQMGKVKEECAELIVALDGYMKLTEGGLADTGVLQVSIAKVIDEIADVFITATQASILFGAEEVRDRIGYKVSLLRGLIKQKEENDRSRQK